MNTKPTLQKTLKEISHREKKKEIHNHESLEKKKISVEEYINEN
jgi:hypothetical protein